MPIGYENTQGIADASAQNVGIVSAPNDPELEAEPYSKIAADIKEKWQKAVTAKLADEQRMLNAFQQYRGVYDDATLSRLEGDRSRVFVKITKTKVLAAYGKILEILFADQRFPISIEQTEMPVGIADIAHLDDANKEDEAKDKNFDDGFTDIYGYHGDGRQIPAGATAKELLNGLTDKYKGLNVKSGPSPDPAHIPTIRPAEESARKMDKIIQEQLTECKATSKLRMTIFEMCLLGTGVFKAPFNYSKTYYNYDDDGKKQELHKTMPDMSPVSVWDFYCDPSATSVPDAEWTIQRHILNSSQVRALRKRPFFREANLLEVLERGPNHIRQWWENYIRDTTVNLDLQRYEFLEYWGTINKADALMAGLEDILSEEEIEAMEELDELQVNCWICGDIIVRLVLNPFTPARLPYMACPYELHPYQLLGIGIPENMSDSQEIMNGHARMAIDNLKLAGNVMIELDETLLVPGQDMEIYAGKIWRRQGGQPGQSIHGFNFPDTSQSNMAIFDRFRMLADEQTGIASVGHGQAGYQTGVRSASQTSMMMNASDITIKTVVSNIDDYLLKPLGQTMFQWNMQFNEDLPEIKGALEIKALGTAAFMQKEVRAQRMNQFLQLASNPAIAPFVNIPEILHEQALNMEIDPDKFVNNPQQAMLYARIIGQAQAASGTGTPANIASSGANPGTLGGSPNAGGSAPSPDLSGNGGGSIGSPGPSAG